MPMGKVAAFVGPHHFDMVELPPPPVEPYGMLVEITAAGICGSDLHYWHGEMKPEINGLPGPVILGHEMTGVVHTLGRNINTDSMGWPLRKGTGRLRLFFPLPALLCMPEGRAEQLPRQIPIPSLHRGVPLLLRRVCRVLLPQPGTLRIQGPR